MIEVPVEVFSEPSVVQVSVPEMSASQPLTCFEMTHDGVKAVKTACDPVSDAFACLCGMLCAVAEAAAQDQEHHHHREEHHHNEHHHHDAYHGGYERQHSAHGFYARRERRREARELRSAYEIGACLGDIVIDSTAILLGLCLGAGRAAALSCIGDNDRSHPVFGIPRERIDDVDLFSSCCCTTP